MKPITFIDTEVDPNSDKIIDIGGVKWDGSSFHSNSIGDFTKFVQGTQYICGHNILNHDLKYIQAALGSDDLIYIDTLFLSPLLFPMKPYHALLKDDKLQTEDINNPLNDSIKAKDLFFDEVTAFQRTESAMQKIYYHLLKDKREFKGFFHFLDYKQDDIDIENEIRQKFHKLICEHSNVQDFISNHPIELAYCLALINTQSRYSITPPWVLKNFPEVERLMYLLRNKPCLRGCPYCDEALDIHKGLKKFFTFDSFRTYAGEPLQERATQAAVNGKSLLAIFPTGGGKSLTFQLPALMSGNNSKGLTVVISPLQSLMKDQVDNLEEIGITEAVTINGLLDPIERAKSIERVENGSASILYIAPESLRSKTIERLLLGRNVVRFVIDEAHCFSAWGQDFRVDYLYIGDFIKEFQEKKNLQDTIPISCFTATAKQQVIEDIREYFKEKLSLDLELYRTGASRTNLRYRIINVKDEENKYNIMRNLIEEKNCPTIIYVTHTRTAYLIAQRLAQDGYSARAYHGKMDKQEKTENQDAFIKGDVQIMVATSAFGMGVDKKDVGTVIHYEISDSLENYIQEAGRAGRDENISANCYVLFNDQDLNKHFILQNQTKISIKEIQQIWRAIKEITRVRERASQSALEIARKAGWDENISNIETRVKTAITALEGAGYIKRGQNSPRVFADSILSKNAMEAIDKINKSDKFDKEQKVIAARIIQKLISCKSRSRSPFSNEEAESRVDYIAEHLGLHKRVVIQIVNLLREERILADAKDLIAFIKKNGNENRSLAILRTFMSIERFMLKVIDREEKTLSIKELNEAIEQNGCDDVTPNKIKKILNFWAIKNWIKKQNTEYSRNHIVVISLHDREKLEERLTKRYDLAEFILEYLYARSKENRWKSEDNKEETPVEFSVLELKEEFERRLTVFNTKVTSEDVEDALFYLSRIETLKIEGGFLVTYNALTIERLEQDTRKRYKAEDYRKLEQFYQNKIQQVHIVGEYAKKMLENYKAALQFVDDYFQLNYTSFLNKYFKGSRQNEICRSITPAKFKQLFGELSPAQLKIINDNQSKYIVVAAGPGSGKTRILVHKLASLILMEDVKHEQLLMLTFSRSAATEFKKRLLKLIGNASNFIEIKTFHSYCFDLLGRVGTIEKSDEIIKKTIAKIQNNEVDKARITKTVLVVDEAQDMDSSEYELIKTLMEQNEEMRVIAVGDDDQNIFEFRGSSSEYLKELIVEHNAVLYEMVENYRSKSNLVDFSNQFIKRLSGRLKYTPIIAVQRDRGKIKLVRYSNSKLIIPLADDIMSADLSGSSCVLTKTNNEALQVAGLLTKNGIRAKLIQSNDEFNLYNLLEIRFFLEQLNLTESTYTIDSENWENAKRKLKEKFTGSLNFEVCMNLIKDFEAVNPKQKYKTDLGVFIRESRLEDFLSGDNDTIFVSTIHKSKGREFDNVFLMLEQSETETDEWIRQLYVAITRAKSNLTIHCNGGTFDSIKSKGLQVIRDSKLYSQPQQLVIRSTFRDVWLGYFSSCQNAISRLISGDVLSVDGEACRNSEGQVVVKFSKQMISRIEALKQKNYIPKTAKVKFIVYWKSEDLKREIKILLPELYFERNRDGD